MNKLILVCLVIGLVGCGKSQEEIRLEKENQAKALEQEKIKKLEKERIETENKIKELVKNDLLDPESAIFKFQSKNDSNIHCGTVNSKNRFGGYVGDTRFIYTGSGYVMDNYQPSDDLFKQTLHLLTFEQTWISKCEGIKPKQKVDLKECENYSEMALVASHSYINNQNLPFNDIKRIVVKVHKHPKHLSEFFDAVRKLNVSAEDQSFPMMYAKVQYAYCLQGNTSSK